MMMLVMETLDARHVCISVRKLGLKLTRHARLPHVTNLHNFSDKQPSSNRTSLHNGLATMSGIVSTLPSQLFLELRPDSDPLSMRNL